MKKYVVIECNILGANVIAQFDDKNDAVTFALLSKKNASHKDYFVYETSDVTI